MNRIYEATKFSGAHALVSPVTIDRYFRTARLHYGNGKRALRMAGRFLASFMYFHDFSTLVEIKYDDDGQSRTTVITKR